MFIYFSKKMRVAVVSISFVLLPLAVTAAPLPGPADVGRIKPEERLQAPDHSQDDNIAMPQGAMAAQMPPGAEHVHLKLKEVHIEGATAFTKDQLQGVYADSLGKDITLDKIYAMAAEITQRYRNAGYFLSLAYIPNQQIQNGVITIKVVEGYVGKIDLNPAVASQRVVRDYLDRLLAQKPLKADTIESILLRLNDLPGLSFRAVLSPLSNAGEGAVKLTLVSSGKAGKGTISYDNYSSRYLGPNEATATYDFSLLPLQETTISGLTSIPFSKLRYGALQHSIVLAPDWTFDVTGNITKAFPGFTLSPEDINSESVFLGAGISYQWIRQRQENLNIKFSIDGRNTTSDVLDTPLTRDRIRALRANATYDLTDAWGGYNIANFTLSHGLDGLGSSEAGDPNLSRTDAKPDFTKAELSLTRLQDISANWSVLFAADSQIASGTLYSAEEFGYGGQAFGRAYDTSEITGDQGVSGSIELRYGGFTSLQPLSLQPYTFYDIGTVWNMDITQPGRESGSSAGFGIRGATSFGLTANFALAQPLTRDIATPIYGGSGHNPRFLMQITQSF